MRHLLLGILLTLSTITLSARGPLYVLNGVRVESIESVEQSNIERIDHLPATEETIERWGIEASEGVIMVTLKYDTPARFEAEGHSNFTTYLQHKVKWDKNMPNECRYALRSIARVEQPLPRYYNPPRANTRSVWRGLSPCRHIGSLQRKMARPWRAHSL